MPWGSTWNHPQTPRRGLSAALTLLVHCAAFVLLLTWSARPAMVHGSANVATFDLPMPGPAAKTPPQAARPRAPSHTAPPVIAPPVPVLVPMQNALVASLLKQVADQETSGGESQALALASAGGCDLTAPVQAALQADQQVQQLLPSIPPERRSVANAMAIWNQAWLTPDATVDPKVYETIRLTVATAIGSASEECRTQPQAGPRLVYLPAPTAQGGTTVLAMGSGEWTWQQVADTARPEVVLALNAPLERPAGTQLADMLKSMFSP